MAKSNKPKKPKFDVIGSLGDAMAALTILAMALPDEDPDKETFMSTKAMVKRCKIIVEDDLRSTETEAQTDDESEDNDVESETETEHEDVSA